MAANRHLVLRADDIMAFQLPHAQHYLSQEILGGENTALHDSFLNQGTLRPHMALGGGAHPHHDEIYYVISGRGSIRLGGDPHTGAGADTYLVEAGSVVYIPANSFHALRNDSDHDIVFLTIWPQRTSPGDNGMHDERIKAWGTAFRVNEGCQVHETSQGLFVTAPDRHWNPLLAEPAADEVLR
jgi:mannose-6-phosphate isomerase-like protein (cupin superfamily)